MQLHAFLLAALSTAVLGAPAKLVTRTARTTAPAGCLTVGSSGKYSTIGAALTALGSSSAAACIYVASGTYEEQLTINYAGALTLYGETTYEESYKENTVTITHTISSPEAGSLDASATVNVVADGFKMHNINVVNGFGKGAQAVALVANADKLGFYACQFSGYQDTLYAKSGTQYYANSRIEGAVDYIFGAASAWFNNCDIVSNGPGAITASSRQTTTDTTWYALDRCNIKAASSAVLDSTVYLGRPWRGLARVIYQNSNLGSIVNAKGWTTLAEGATPLYYEYNNSGAGSDTSAREYETPISAAVTKDTVLGSDYADWIESGY
ncbi:CAZyme family CE8 [Penicillium roqueforti]|uniref:CAZyme family CE8 n=1 Tax=Penicillium roqueforti TaxID=5082 RepID=UPI00190CA3ED|nr:CAZyme family CE8 [Penicillium roqueforti]KAF9245080.1 CAZyme family CE8 [Penicillium roqueforti]KAI1833314.1 CAZyme family CE8 [Penicillium roqueforti]KAI2671154.1 CAZyme family CE8 [Penicillium roqueforti]KAI2671253.1 CAZyme family CE8 [Penicillium roqueforti]KAI2697523.1 CAZyme family CE8 [Penicillium roqueforti]